MKTFVVAVLVVFLAVPLWSSPEVAWGFPAQSGHSFHAPPFHGQPFFPHHFHHFRHDRFFFGFGVGAVVTAPFWYPGYAYPVYAYPTYPAPVYQAPPPTYWYYCQNPQGYYPYVPQCPGGWLTVVAPAQ